MADWYVSSTLYAAIPAFATSHNYAVGDIIKPSAPTYGASFTFRCTVAGLSGAEPVWTNYPNYFDNQTIVTGGATFQHVTGHSWATAAGTLYTIGTDAYGRPNAGDRVFVSSDHNESYSGGSTIIYGFIQRTSNTFGQVQIMSVNKAGNVPPQVADYQAGAVLSNNGSQMCFDACADVYWSGFTFVSGISGGGSIYFGNWGNRTLYFKNCLFQLTSLAAAPNIQLNTLVKVIFDNTRLQFANAGQQLQNAGRTGEFTWINTQNAFLGTIPTTPIQNTSGWGPFLVLLRGVDLSAITGNLCWPGGWPTKMLIDGCLIAPSVTRYNGAQAQPVNNMDECELVNCFDGTNIIDERWTSAGSVTFDRSTTLVNGAIDDVGAFSLKMVGSPRADTLCFPMTSFHLDTENTLSGAKTASVEVISAGGVLSTNDLALFLEYEGTSGSSFSSFADTLGVPLAPFSALPSSSSIWTNPPATSAVAWNPLDKSSNVVLSSGNIVASPNSSADSGVRATGGLTSGKVYFEVSWSSPGSSFGCGICTVTAPLSNNNSANYVLVQQNGNVWVASTNVANIGSIGTATVCFAIDMNSMQAWCRINNNNWNASPTANPSTGAGGFSMSGIGAPPFFPVAVFNAASSVATANFGATAFAQAIPSGFSSVNSFFTVVQHLLSVNFTPQYPGRIRGLVRLLRPSATVWINPQVRIG